MHNNVPKCKLFFYFILIIIIIQNLNKYTCDGVFFFFFALSPHFVQK